MLFVELALIRWLGANVVYLSYYSNFVLLGSFLGIGIGFLRARSRVNLFPWAPAALTLLVYFVSRFPVQVTNASAQLVFFGSGSSLKTTGLPTWETLPVVFIAVATVMAMIGEGVARSFARFRPLDAYRLDILGSVAGIVAFSALSFANAKPLAWALVVALTFVLLFGLRIGVLQIAAVAGLVVLLGAESLGSADVWSPYYRIDYELQKELTIGIPFLGNLQDRAMTETMGPIYDRTQEHLGTTDAMVIFVRRRLLEAARALRDEGAVPANVDDGNLCRVRPASALLPEGESWIGATEKARQSDAGVPIAWVPFV